DSHRYGRDEFQSCLSVKVGGAVLSGDLGGRKISRRAERASHISRSQNSILAPTWIFRGELATPFHVPKLGLAISVLKSLLPQPALPAKAPTSSFMPTLTDSLILTLIPRCRKSRKPLAETLSS